jgi:hypothetical protein
VRRTPVIAVLLITACTQWSPRPVPVADAFSRDGEMEVAVRLQGDSTHWWRIRHARLAGDSIVGWTKVAGVMRRAAVSADSVEYLVVREPDRIANDALVQLAELATFLGFFRFVTFAFFGG